MAQSAWTIGGAMRSQAGRSGGPAIRRSGDPAIRRSGDPALGARRSALGARRSALIVTHSSREVTHAAPVRESDAGPGTGPVCDLLPRMCPSIGTQPCCKANDECIGFRGLPEGRASATGRARRHQPVAGIPLDSLILSRIAGGHALKFRVNVRLMMSIQ